MRIPISRISHSMALRLFILIAGVQTAILGALAFATITVHQTHLHNHVMRSAARVSDLLVRSTQHSMLRNDKEEVQQILTAVGAEPGINAIRIMNPDGVVIFSTSRDEIHRTILVEGAPCEACHDAGDGAQERNGKHRTSEIIAEATGERVLAMRTPIRNASSCSDASCHAHPPRNALLGIMDVRMSLAQVDASLAETRSQLVTLSLAAVLLVALTSAWFLWTFIRKPVRRLAEGMQNVSTGSLDQRLEVHSTDELGQLARTFNAMTEELSRARDEITEWSTTLEQKVRQKTADLERAHRRLVSVEKMASLGNLAASVAHEINNPLEGILTFAKLSIKKIQKLGMPASETEPVCADLQLVADEAQRCAHIVQNMLAFSRQNPATFTDTHLASVTERCRLLLHHYAIENHVDLRFSCETDDLIECDAGQLQQVIIALIVNAIEAISGSEPSGGGGVVTVAMCADAGQDTVLVRVTDTGPGVPEELRTRIFEPFFTTKSDGRGVGLGLAIAYGIVERHHGTIEADGEGAHGGAFTVTLPRRQPTGQRHHVIQEGRSG